MSKKLIFYAYPKKVEHFGITVTAPKGGLYNVNPSHGLEGGVFTCYDGDKAARRMDLEELFVNYCSMRDFCKKLLDELKGQTKDRAKSSLAELEREAETNGVTIK